MGARFEDWSIRRKVVILSLIASTIPLGLASLGFVLYQARLEQRAERERLSTVAAVMASNSTAALAFGDRTSAAETLGALRSVGNIRSGCVYDGGGQLFVAYPDGEAALCPHDLEPVAPTVPGGAIRVSAPVIVQEETVGTIVLHADLAAVHRRLAGYIGGATALLLVSAALAYLLAAWLQRYISNPILALVATARLVSTEKDYRLRASGDGMDEVGQLIAAFNEMLDQIQDRDREMEAFSYSVSHDLRQPLRGMHGMSQMLLDDYGPQLDDTARDYLTRICLAAKKMDALVHDMLVLARVTRLPMRIERVNVSALAEAVAGDLRASSVPRSVEVHIAPDMTAEADAGLLRAALHNLLENAWKFTAQRADARIEVGVEHRGGSDVFFVRDNGVGLDMAFVHKLFMPFERLHSDPEYTGTGIGLATVQRIVRRHGGDVWCEAAPGEGATFHFTLRAAPGQRRDGTSGGALEKESHG